MLRNRWADTSEYAPDSVNKLLMLRLVTNATHLPLQTPECTA